LNSEKILKPNINEYHTKETVKIVVSKASNCNIKISDIVDKLKINIKNIALASLRA